VAFECFIRFAGEKLELVLKFLRLMKFTERRSFSQSEIKRAAIKTIVLGF
jgi:hypothetical protein